MISGGRVRHIITYITFRLQGEQRQQQEADIPHVSYEEEHIKPPTIDGDKAVRNAQN